MSEQKAREVLERMKTDPTFRDKVLAFEAVEARMQFLNDLGYTCTAREFADVSSELSDDVLAQVAGGAKASSNCSPVNCGTYIVCNGVKGCNGVGGCGNIW